MKDEYTPIYRLKKKKKVDMTKYYGVKEGDKPKEKEKRKKPKSLGVDI